MMKIIKLSLIPFLLFLAILVSSMDRSLSDGFYSEALPVQQEDAPRLLASQGKRKEECYFPVHQENQDLIQGAWNIIKVNNALYDSSELPVAHLTLVETCVVRAQFGGDEGQLYEIVETPTNNGALLLANHDIGEELQLQRVRPVATVSQTNPVASVDEDGFQEMAPESAFEDIEAVLLADQTMTLEVFNGRISVVAPKFEAQDVPLGPNGHFSFTQEGPSGEEVTINGILMNDVSQGQSGCYIVRIVDGNHPTGQGPSYCTHERIEEIRMAQDEQEEDL